MKYTGHCICGAVKYEIEGEPALQGNCHCTNCQRMTGSAYSASMFFPESAIHVHGNVKQFGHAGESGTTTLTFCPECGTQLFSKPVMMKGLTGVRAGTLDNPNLYKPAADIFTRSATSWDHMNPDIPKFKTYPPMG